ncbi:VapE domain-containing protein [Agathobaculum sp. LCP25S3_E8]|uniref:VapE domain-containing protein n=1 Tax=Agathobaculum sp. LCP25S3_E8 TaxID=3438735 RepID=UPI003F906956
MQNCQQSQSVAEVRGNLDLTDNGAIKNTIKNCLTVFQNDPNLQGAIRFNILTGRIDIVKPLWWDKETATLNDTDFAYLMLYLEDNYSLTSEKKIQKAISLVADSNKYHPVRDYLNSLEWDGTERIRYALKHFLGADDSEYTYECLKLFMLGAISRVFKPGCKFEVMLCLVGGQGAGKSTFFRFLAVKDEWFSDDLKKIDDDNVYRKMQGHWLIEMSEMIATATAKSIEDIKSFISRTKETYKVPYETHPADRLRQCVFGGSSNNLDFLPLDRSGNRRFMPIMVHAEQAEVHILDDEAASRDYIDKMWAEAMFIYQNFPVRLSLPKHIEKELKELQKDFMPEDTKAGLIQAYLENPDIKQVCSKQLYAEALNHPFDDPRQWEIREINDIMNSSIDGWRPFSNPRSFGKYGRQKGWERIAPSGNRIPATGSNSMDGFIELTEEELSQMELPF